MRQTKEFLIGGERYSATQLGALEGRKLHLRFVKLLAGILPAVVALKGSVAKGGDPDADPSDSDETKLSKLLERVSEDQVFDLISKALETIDERDIEAFWTAFQPITWLLKPGGRTQLDAEFFDHHFAGKYIEMLKLLIELLRFNFGGFLAGLGGDSEANAAPPTAN